MITQNWSPLKRLATLIALATALSVPLSQTSLGQVFLVDDFENYAVDSSIHEQGNWEAQANTSDVQDNFHSNVVIRDGDKALQMVNRDNHGPEPDLIQTVYTSMALPTAIQTGTIYMRWMKSSEAFTEAGDLSTPLRGDMIFATNGRFTGFDPDGNDFVPDFGDPAGVGQGIATYVDEAALVGLWATAAGHQFHARDNGSYKDVDTPFAGNLVHDEWYEMWVQVDHTANQQTRYYLAQDGETPQVVMNGASEWWGHRNDAYSSATAIKFLNGTTFGRDISVYVDTIGVDPTGWSTNSLLDEGTTTLPGDANDDGVVDLLDLDILGTNFGATPATFAQGDFNGDNTVDLLDLDILGTNFGSGGSAVAVPEPSALLTVGTLGLLSLVKRKRSALLR